MIQRTGFFSRLTTQGWVSDLLDATVLKLARFVAQARQQAEIDAERGILLTAIALVSPDRRVKHGVFRGMICPPHPANSNLFFPPLLGCYEQELQPTLAEICQQPYSEIVDIGCAEGYYAVGLARRIPSAKTIFAYDNNEEAIALCREAATLNGVGDRVVTGAFCDAETLINLPLGSRALIFCDCEGYEKALFTPAVAQRLAKHDVLVEIHDGVDLYISSQIRGLFEATHDIVSIPVMTDIQRANSYDYPELAGYDLATKKILVAEHRANSTEWLYIKARS
jgi:SAM-dependent methyltransferase